MALSDKVLVVNEPFVKDFCRTQRWAARTRGRVLRAPDWLAYTTAVLEKEVVDVELYDFPAKNWGKERLYELVTSKRPSVVVLDSTTPSIYSDIECARLCKQASDGTHVVMVGPHASALPDEVLKDGGGAVDAVVRGEYEHTVRDFVLGILNDSGVSNVAGISYINGSGIVHNPERPLIHNLDELPFPAWHHLNLWDYFDGTKLYPYIDIIGGRGCPYKCIFCLWPQVMHGNRYRLRSAENIVDEMEWVLSEWPRTRDGEFFFEDDTFTVNRQRAHAICDEIERRRLRCTWSVNTRADVLDADLFRHMKSANCRMVLVGFESGSQEMLNRMEKRASIEGYRRFIEIVTSAGLVIHGCFVLGLPGETIGTMEETIRFALSNNLNTVQFSAAVPFPGTKYFDYISKEGLLLAKRWDDWLNNGEQGAVVDYPGLSSEKIEHYVNKGLKDFYFRPSYMFKFLIQTRGKKDLYRKFRGMRNFLSYLLGRR